MTRVTTACVWCGRPTHAVDSVCPGCIGIDRRNHAMPTDDDALTDGAWRFDPFRRVQVWVPAEPVEADLHQLIACPTCHARVDQTCRTRNGHRTTNHGNRLTPRLCSCGAPLEPKKQMCPPCAKEANLVSHRESYARREAEKRAARRLATVTAIGAGWAGDEDEEGAA